MIEYAIIMFLFAGLFGVVSVLIYKGNTNLIHDYHQSKVTDKTGYGKDFGKATGVLAGAMALSGIVALVGEGVFWVAVCVLVTGFVAGIAAIVQVQKKYNGGVF